MADSKQKSQPQALEENYSPADEKKRLKEDWSSNPRMSAISFELLLLYKRSRLASASTRSWMTRRGDGNLQEEKMFERVLGDLCNKSA